MSGAMAVAPAGHRRGLLLALASVGWVTLAQLSMRWSMVRLPQPSRLFTTLETGSLNVYALGVVLGAIVAYGLSMLCWLAALRDLPLARAYSLLSISYALVYLLAAVLPFFNEPLTVTKTVGVTLIVLGVVTINFRRSSNTSGKEFPR